MIRWRFFEPSPARDFFDRWMQELPRGYRGELGRGEPMPMNVHQTENETVIEAALPGVKPEDVEITGNEGVLTIRAHSRVEEKDYHHQEIYSLEYQRQLTVPPDVKLDQAKAEFENGILRIHLPKQQPKAPERVRIEVKGGTQGKTAIDAPKGEGYSEVQSSGGSPERKTSGGKSSADGGPSRRGSSRGKSN
jgi:HSP20 family protein